MRDKNLWKNPDIFSPENFLDENGEFVSNEAFIPYGMGPRVCLGQNLADLELKIAMCELVRKFKISCAEKIDLDKKVQRITCAPYPHKYTFTTRWRRFKEPSDEELIISVKNSGTDHHTKQMNPIKTTLCLLIKYILIVRNSINNNRMRLWLNSSLLEIHFTSHLNETNRFMKVSKPTVTTVWLGLLTSKVLMASLLPPNPSARPAVTASSYRSLNALTEVEEPAGMGESLGTGAHRHRSILPPGVKYVPGPRVLRRILSNRS